MTDLEWMKYVEKVARTVPDPILMSDQMNKPYQRKKKPLTGLQKYEEQCKLVDEVIERYKEKESEQTN